MTAAPLPPLVVTGATGFVGARVVQQLLAEHERQVAVDAAVPRPVTLIVRNPGSPSLPSPLPASWHVVACDLATDAPPPGTVPQGGVVLHLAASTGRVSESELRDVNVEGTRRILAAARAGPAAHVVFVSSIAAAFADRRWYPYATSKLEAERLVAESGLPFTTVRPTMVFGPGSPVQEGLQRLALGPAPIVLGSGMVKVQPVHVDDLAAVLVRLASSPAAGAPLLYAAGPDVLSIRELMARMRSAHGQPPRTPRSIPLAIPRRLLAAAERLIGPRLPITAGQLASFVNDSSAANDAPMQRLIPVARSLDEMLASGLHSRVVPRPGSAADRSGRDTGTEAGNDAAPGALEREFAVFARYLGTPSPSRRATDAYLRSHRSAAATPVDRFDRWLVAVARVSPLGCGLADAYARRVRPFGLLRRKLVLSLAVLESSPDVHARFDTARPSHPLVAWGLLVAAGCGWIARTAAAVVLLAPLQLAARIAPAHAADD